LRPTHQLVEGARIKKDETRWTAFGDRPKLPRLDDRLRHRTRHRDCIAEWMIEVQNSYGLTEGIHHVMIAIGMERIAAIVTRDRDGYAAVAHFVDRRDAAPTWRPPVAPILKIRIDGWQRHYRDARLGSPDWSAGCRAAAERLAAPDRRRQTERDYRAGWNDPVSTPAVAPAPRVPERISRGTSFRPARRSFRKSSLTEKPAAPRPRPEEPAGKVPQP
jgi:hypothetical protein